MALSKSDIIDAIASVNGYPRKKATATVEPVIDIIKSNLASGDDILISSPGKFCINEN